MRYASKKKRRGKSHQISNENDSDKQYAKIP